MTDPMDMDSRGKNNNNSNNKSSNGNKNQSRSRGRRGGGGRGGGGANGGRGNGGRGRSPPRDQQVVNNKTNGDDYPSKPHHERQGSSNSNNKTAPPKKRPRRSRSNICFQYAKTGTCERGETCKFAHETPTNEETTDPPFNEDSVMPDQEEVEEETTTPTTMEQEESSSRPHITNHKFSELQIATQTRKALADVFQYEYMTVVQHETLPLILQGKDVLAKAKTGTGKTLGFMIPTIEGILQQKSSTSKMISCLVLSPTRELALQITTETEKLTRFHPRIKTVTCVGGTNKNKDIRALNHKMGVQIVVATPGRLLDHLQNTEGIASRMSQLTALILDEADQLLDMGFRPDIERILRLLHPSVETRQTLLFSATVPKSVSEIAKVALKPQYEFVDTVGADAEQTHVHVPQQVIVVPQEEQIVTLANLLAKETTSTATPYKIIVFFTTARLTGFLAELFNSVSDDLGYSVLEIHSRKSQTARQKASDIFRQRRNAVLFSSDVSARGMDYPNVTCVLQVGLTERSQYIHRLGRTARAGKQGKGTLLLVDYEAPYMTQKELKGLPLQSLSMVLDTDASHTILPNAIRSVQGHKTLQGSAEQAYRAWLGYYNGALKKCGWNKKMLVQQGNAWAREVGLAEPPSLLRRTVGKMGLKGVPGLKIE